MKPHRFCSAVGAATAFVGERVTGNIDEEIVTAKKEVTTYHVSISITGTSTKVTPKRWMAAGKGE